MVNQSFRPDFSNPQQNAIVGAHLTDNVDFSYREGFKQATLALLATAAVESYIDPNTEETAYVSVDALIYPICFNARHFVELFLKESIRIASALGNTSHQAVVKPTHDLTELWSQFEVAIARDKRLKALGMLLKDVIMDIATTDNTGMVFRYPRDLGGNMHFPKVEHINLHVLGNYLRKMFERVDEFYLFLQLLQQEYAQNTFTSKLNRAEIEAIARQLPSVEKWPEELRSIKNNVCERYSLSSRDFNKALQIIKRHREFAFFIGLELPLAELPTDIFKRLARVHSGEANHDVITRDEWWRLNAVMEMNRLESFSESYDDYLNLTLSPDYQGYIDPEHIARNAYARNQRLRGGLQKLGQKTLLAALAEAIPELAVPFGRQIA